MRVSRLVLAVLVCLAIPFGGCGYHVAGKASQLPTSVHTVAIPVFTNQTHSYRIETILTNAVVREFNSRTNYRIVTDPREADAILRGYVITTQTAPVTYDSQTGRASTALVTVTMNVSLYDKAGKTLYRNNNYLFREQYQISRELSSFFEEESPALDRMSRDFARTLVSNVLEAY
jgi:outer membrane lipopolysaccharide assembly protein LptE/RlpB